MTLLPLAFVALCGTGPQEEGRRIELDMWVPGGAMTAPPGYRLRRKGPTEGVVFHERDGSEVWKTFTLFVSAPREAPLGGTKLGPGAASRVGLPGHVQTQPHAVTWREKELEAYVVRFTAKVEGSPLPSTGVLALVPTVPRPLFVLLTGPLSHEDVISEDAQWIVDRIEGPIDTSEPPPPISERRATMGLVVLGVGGLLNVVGYVWALVIMFQARDHAWAVWSIVLCAVCGVGSLAALFYSITNKDRASGAMWLILLGSLLACTGLMISGIPELS